MHGTIKGNHSKRSFDLLSLDLAPLLDQFVHFSSGKSDSNQRVELASL